MYTVTGRINAITQPRGGYLPARSFIAKRYDDGKILNPTENVHGSLVGLAVDYLTRYRVTKNLSESFEISIRGASILLDFDDRVREYCLTLLKNISEGDVASAIKIVAFDDVYRAGVMDIRIPSPDAATVENVEIMVQRGVNFLVRIGPLVKSNFTFEGGYTDTVVNGDGDYLTRETLVDFKVLRSNINSKHTLQLLMYYLMGLRSIHPEFKTIKFLAIFNPRKNTVYYLPTKKIPAEVADEVSTKVIGYGQ